MLPPVISKTIWKSQKRLIATQLKPRKGTDIKLILIENIYSLFRELFLMNRLYMFSISINLISVSFRGFNCVAISLFWDGSRWRARRFMTFWYCFMNKYSTFFIKKLKVFQKSVYIFFINFDALIVNSVKLASLISLM